MQPGEADGHFPRLEHADWSPIHVCATRRTCTEWLQAIRLRYVTAHQLRVPNRLRLLVSGRFNFLTPIKNPITRDYDRDGRQKRVYAVPTTKFERPLIPQSNG